MDTPEGRGVVMAFTDSVLDEVKAFLEMPIYRRWSPRRVPVFARFPLPGPGIAHWSKACYPQAI